MNIPLCVKDSSVRILFTEGRDRRMMEAALRLYNEQILTPLLYGDTRQLYEQAEAYGLSLTGIQIVDPKRFTQREDMIRRMLELRKGKTDERTCREWLKMDTYFCTMYVELGYADGLLGGSANSTADTLRPIMQLIKTRMPHTIVSSCFLMSRRDEHYIFADCSLNRNPNTDELVEIALQAAESAKTFQLEPKVALLSYSTHGSGSGTDVDTVREAAQRLQRMPLDYDVDGELQVDCALSRRVAELKAVDSTVGGNANVLIFPDLNAGNIGYKLVANLGGFEALGPILQGVRLPMNDLSRSATTEEIYKMAIITAMQKEAGKKMRRHGNADSIDLGI